MIEGKVYKLDTNTTQQGSGMLKRPMKWKCEVLTSNVILIKIVSVKVFVIPGADCHRHLTLHIVQVYFKI